MGVRGFSGSDTHNRPNNKDSGSNRAHEPRIRRLVLVVDVEHYSGRDYDAQMTVQDGVAHALDHACSRAGVPWNACARQDRGDGQLLLLPGGIDESKAVPGLILGLRDMLPVLNARVPDEHRIRLRVALAQGAVQKAPLGYVAWSVELASRLLDSAELRAELAAADASDMALIVPDDLYADAFLRGAGGLPASTLRHVRVEIPAKNFAADAWIGALPPGRTAPLGIPTLPPDGPLDRPRRQLARHAGQAAVGLGGGLLMLREVQNTEHHIPDGSGDDPAGHHTPLIGHSAPDAPAGRHGRVADAAESIAALGDQVTDDTTLAQDGHRSHGTEGSHGGHDLHVDPGRQGGGLAEHAGHAPHVPAAAPQAPDPLWAELPTSAAAFGPAGAPAGYGDWEPGPVHSMRYVGLEADPAVPADSTGLSGLGIHGDPTGFADPSHLDPIYADPSHLEGFAMDADTMNDPMSADSTDADSPGYDDFGTDDDYVSPAHIAGFDLHASDGGHLDPSAGPHPGNEW
jgi:hypothetical protein